MLIDLIELFGVEISFFDVLLSVKLCVYNIREFISRLGFFNF